MMLPTYAEILEWLPELLRGLRLSLEVTLLSLVLGIPLGFVLALGVISKQKALSSISLFIVEIGRGAPALVVLQFVYFGLPNIGLTLTSFLTAVVALAFNTGAYTSEMIRASLQAIDQGQREAAEAIGLSSVDEMRFVLLPQSLRIALPALLGFSILTFQGTSLCFTIALPELVSKAYDIGANTFRYFPALICAGALYAIISIPAALLVSHVERRAGVYAQR